MGKNKKTIVVINGPNLNMLGRREPEIYGSLSLDQINKSLVAQAEGLGLALEFFQSNHEGVIIDKIHELFEQRPAGIIINPGALTHSSIALRDALLLMTCPLIEIHLSNIHKRESFRRKSMIADIAEGQIAGFGAYGYSMALSAVADILSRQ